jgi:hypothetical protein
LVGATLLFGVVAVTAQSFPCASVAPEVREQVRQAGACRDTAPSDAAPASAVTVRLPDGTVARVPREIASNLDEARRQTAGKTEAQAEAPTKVESTATVSPPAPPKPEVDASHSAAANTTPATTAATSPPASTAPLTTEAPATDAAPASRAPAASAAAVPHDPGSRLPIVLPANAALILVSGVLLGLLFGVLLTRQWLRRREPVVHVDPVPPALLPHQFPVEREAGVVPAASAAPEPALAAVRFAAHREPGETTIVLTPRSEGTEEAVEHSSHHA